MEFDTEKLKYDKDGLIPAIAQDFKTGKVLMLAYMNKESLGLTLRTKKAHYWSRSRKKLWFKGEESGNTQEIKQIFVDCDLDCILIKVDQKGGAACHTGYESCFYREVDGNLDYKITDKPVFNPDEVYKKK